MSISVKELILELGAFGLEGVAGRYYSSYFGTVTNFYAESDHVDIEVFGIHKESVYFHHVPLKKSPYLNFPIEVGTKVIVSFMWGELSYPMAELAYHRYDKKEDKSSKDERLVDEEYVRFLSPDGLLFKEVEGGFEITKGELSLIFTESLIEIKNRSGKITLKSDFEVELEHGRVKLNDKRNNRMVNFNNLYTFLVTLVNLVQGHVHLADSTPPSVPFNQPSFESLSIDDVFGG